MVFCLSLNEHVHDTTSLALSMPLTTENKTTHNYTALSILAQIVRKNQIVTFRYKNIDRQRFFLAKYSAPGTGTKEAAKIIKTLQCYILLQYACSTSRSP